MIKWKPSTWNDKMEKSCDYSIFLYFPNIITDHYIYQQGPSYVRFKAEIFFDTETITTKYLGTLDTTSLLKVNDFIFI